MKDKRIDAEQAARERIVVTEKNYLDWQLLPNMTANLRAFMREKNGCRYCRALNVPPSHRANTCPKLEEDKKANATRQNFR